jgi:Tol biopolymer transport system component
MQSDGPITLAELLSAGTPLTADDAAAVVSQLCRATPAGRPTMTRVSAEQVAIDADGHVQLATGVLPTVRDAGTLLEQLLEAVRQAKPGPLPRRLVFLAANATGQLSVGGIASLTALAEALAPFAPPDPQAALQALHARGRTLVTSPPPMPARPRPRPPVEAVVVPAAAPTPEPVQPPEPLPEPLPERVPEPLPTLAYEPDPPIQADVEPAVGAAPLSVFDAPDEEPWDSRRGQRSGARLAALAAAALVAGALGALVAMRESGRATERIAEAAESAPIVEPAAPAAAPTTPEPKPAEGGGTPEDRPATPDAAPAEPAPAAAGDVPAASTVLTALPAQPPQRLVDPHVAEADAVFSPSFSANGTAVFFHARTDEGSALKRADRGESGELHVATIVDDGANNYHVQLSPDGESVAFDSDRDGVRGVYIARADGHDVRRVSGPGYAAVPSWSPDGSRLAFVRAEFDRRAVWNLWVLDLSTQVTTRLTNHRFGQVWGGAWFPDGRRIAYSHEDQLVIRELGSGKSTAYPTPVKGKLVRTPAVSPDGKSIVFQVHRDGAWLLDTATGFKQRVLDDPTAEEFTWSPDGRRVAFHSRRSGGWGLWTITAP